MSEWRDTPEGEAIWAELLDGERVRFSALRRGDVFRGWWNGEHIDPTTHETTEAFFRACDDARPADGTETAQDFGWCLMVEEIDDPKKVLA